MFSELVRPAWLADWCRDELGGVPTETLLRVEQMSQVFGLRLDNGREVVVKARADPYRRIASCVRAQSHLFKHGFPCPEPVTAVTYIDEMAVHAETWRPGGEMLVGDTAENAGHFARLLAILISDLTSIGLEPPVPSPMWVNWDHPGTGVWPEAAFLDERDQSLVPDFVVAIAQRTATRLRATDLPRVVGHADWESQNLRWHGTQPWVVHDWDSLAWLPEAAIVGSAAGAFASSGAPTLTSVHSSQAFLSAYQQQRGRRFTTEEIEIAWAASLWLAAHNARAQALFAQPPVAATALTAQAAQRLALAGA
jgi:phosphotransferase family enzyme